MSATSSSSTTTAGLSPQPVLRCAAAAGPGDSAGITTQPLAAARSCTRWSGHVLRAVRRFAVRATPRRPDHRVGEGGGSFTDRSYPARKAKADRPADRCLLYTSDAADEEDSVDLGG